MSFFNEAMENEIFWIPDKKKHLYSKYRLQLDSINLFFSQEWKGDHLHKAINSFSKMFLQIIYVHFHISMIMNSYVVMWKSLYQLFVYF